MPDNERRKTEIDLAVLTSKVDSLADSVVRHMDAEEEERKSIWKELTRLDRRQVIFFTLLLTTAGGPNIAEFAQYLL